MSTKTLVGTPDPEPEPRPLLWGNWYMTCSSSTNYILWYWTDGVWQSTSF